jgi:hypothetical protein
MYTLLTLFSKMGNHIAYICRDKGFIFTDIILLEKSWRDNSNQSKTTESEHNCLRILFGVNLGLRYLKVLFRFNLVVFESIIKIILLKFL